MTNCRHLILFLVVQKILASLKLTTVFTVTTECISQLDGSEKKFQLQPGIIIIAHSQNRTRFFRRNWDSFFFIWYGHATTKKVSHKVDETECRWAKCAPKCAPSEGNSDGAPWRGSSERCCPTSLSCRLPLSVQKQNFSSVVAASGFVWQKIAL